ncbi:hypothetical protein I3842_05G160800 [Carya illinoinensis]|uniref:DUF4371 domain-containing protein n=1 Tax=Carya illinoinensis TaxID=32201 RepID=A0A922JMS2_CARIL|nr:hypothetical protein I3842_05G160800 [Carya illinoinensis]
MDAISLECDPGLRPQIWEFPTDLQDEIQRAYIKAGPYQPKLSEYPFLAMGNQLNDVMNCPLIGHMGRDPNSPHKNAVKYCEDLMNQSRHIDKLVEKQVSQEIENNQLRLKNSIDSVRWLMFQACAFKGHDESSYSKNQGNLIKLIKLLANYNDQNAKYTSPKIQKEILHIFVNKVRNMIREKIETPNFVLLLTKLKDELKREQMTIILRDMMEEGIFMVNGMDYKLYFLKDGSYAYYVHCSSHKLQLALVATSREAKHVHQFFVSLTSIIYIVVGSSKCNDELESAQAVEIESLIASNEIETGKEANQIDTLDVGSHFQSVSYMVLTSFEFIQILHMMKKIMGITNALYQSLQQNFQDIVNAMSLSLFYDVKSFCEKHQIDILYMNSQYTRARGKSRRQVDKLLTTMEHHFRIDIFTVTIDFKLQELNNRFNNHIMELLILSIALNPKDAYKSFKIDDICKLVEKFYPQDFTKQEKFILKIQL